MQGFIDKSILTRSSFQYALQYPDGKATAFFPKKLLQNAEYITEVAAARYGIVHIDRGQQVDFSALSYTTTQNLGEIVIGESFNQELADSPFQTYHPIVSEALAYNREHEYANTTIVAATLDPALLLDEKIMLHRVWDILHGKYDSGLSKTQELANYFAGIKSIVQRNYNDIVLAAASDTEESATDAYIALLNTIHPIVPCPHMIDRTDEADLIAKIHVFGNLRKSGISVEVLSHK